MRGARSEQGVDVFLAALEAPFRQIVHNHGLVHPPVALGNAERLGCGYGFDVRTGTYVDMRQQGIVDSLQVTRGALRLATSTALSLLTPPVSWCCRAKRSERSVSAPEPPEAVGAGEWRRYPPIDLPSPVLAILPRPGGDLGRRAGRGCPVHGGRWLESISAEPASPFRRRPGLRRGLTTGWWPLWDCPVARWRPHLATLHSSGRCRHGDCSGAVAAL